LANIPAQVLNIDSSIKNGNYWKKINVGGVDEIVKEADDVGDVDFDENMSDAVDASDDRDDRDDRDASDAMKKIERNKRYRFEVGEWVDLELISQINPGK
jgi:hypothetical protein